ncbi:MAG: hypothetical protein MI975_28665 [Cytophagales bacterium]|nr:hypothetical protein [Cytophagales bacterium]
MKPVRPEQIQDTYEHDYISLCISSLKKYKRMKKYSKRFIIILPILLEIIPGNAQPEENKYSSFLRRTLHANNNFWVRIHAAEALISNNYTIDAEQIFRIELDGNGAEKIGALRVLARIYQTGSHKYDITVKRILHQFEIAQSRHERLVALETIGKLNLSVSNWDIEKLAQTGPEGQMVMACWVMSNSGCPPYFDKLVDFIASGSPKQFRYAAYSLRFMNRIPPEAYFRMKGRLDQVDKGHPFRVYLLSALYFHAPRKDINTYKKQLLAYLDGEKYEKYEVFEVLAARGDEGSIHLIGRKFEEEKDDDVRIAAAKAYLIHKHKLQ